MVVIDRMIRFVLCLAVISELSAGSPWSWFFLRTKRQACNVNDEFTCLSGQCIQNFNMCDGSRECADGSDETSTVCKQLNIKCPFGTFKCTYGACIDGYKKCNTVPDCADGSDENEQVCIDASNFATNKGKCNDNEFTCNSRQCIDEFSVCDAKRDCNDGSDETITLCNSIRCFEGYFRCNYGACIDNILLCNGNVDCIDSSDEEPVLCNKTVIRIPKPEDTRHETKDVSIIPPMSTNPSADSCALPPHPNYGFYSSTLCKSGDVSLACNEVPGTIVPENWGLLFQCYDGYQLPPNYQIALCWKGNWTPFIPSCIKLCPKLVSLSVELKCSFGRSYVDCNQQMKPGTKVIGTCNKNYHHSDRLYSSHPVLECQDNGTWTAPLYHCSPVCGIANVQNPEDSHDIEETLISYAYPTFYGQYPWHVGLYRRANENSEWDQVCGGTLINPHVVLTAAHCVYESRLRGKIFESELKVGLGKYYREWAKEEAGNNDQKRDVQEIVLGPNYEGKLGSYAHDIALIDLKTSVPITNFIRPACIDTERKSLPSPGEYGTLVGWGKTQLNKSSPVLLTVQLPYVKKEECRSNNPPEFQHYITPDKFCAGYKNATGARKGDSGSGLTFVDKDGKHNVHGIVSTTVKNLYTYSTYTNVTSVELLQWLLVELQKLNDKHLHES